MEYIWSGLLQEVVEAGPIKTHGQWDMGRVQATGTSSLGNLVNMVKVQRTCFHAVLCRKEPEMLSDPLTPAFYVYPCCFASIVIGKLEM